MSKKKVDLVNHPKHYCMGKYEVIDVLEDWKLGPHEWQVVRYIARAKHKKNELQDLEKAAVYLKRRIKQLKKEKLNAKSKSTSVPKVFLAKETYNPT